MWPQVSQASRSRSSPGIAPKTSADPQREQNLSESAIHDGTPRPDGRSVERPSRPRSERHARRTTIEAATSAASPIRLTTTQARRKSPFDAVDRHPGPGRAPDPQDRVGGRDDEQRRGDEDAQLDEQAARGGAEFERRDRDRARDEHRDTQENVVVLERRRGDLGDRARRQALEARREDAGCARPAGRGPASLVPSAHLPSYPSVVRVRPGGRSARLERARLVGVGAVDDDLAGRAVPARLERRAAAAVADAVRRRATRARPSRRAAAAPRRGRGRRRSARTTSAAGAAGRASTRRSARARGGAGGR